MSRKNSCTLEEHRLLTVVSPQPSFSDKVMAFTFPQTEGDFISDLKETIGLDGDRTCTHEEIHSRNNLSSKMVTRKKSPKLTR